MQKKLRRTKILRALYMHRQECAIHGTWEDWTAYATLPAVILAGGPLGWRARGRNYAHNHSILKRNYTK